MMKKYLILSTVIHMLAISVITLYLNTIKTVNQNPSSLPTINISISKVDHLNKNIKEKSQPLLENKNHSSEETTKREDQIETLENSLRDNHSQSINITPPKLLYLPPFEYPHQARVKRIEGSVLLKLTITTNGSTANISILRSSGSDVLDTSAIEYLKKIVFEPAKTLEGTPVETEITYLLHFVLK